MKVPLVIYHAHCYDGFTAAWIAKQVLPTAVLHGASHGQPPPPLDLCRGRHVYILDFSYARNVMEEIAAVSASLLVLDHHVTAQAACAGLPFCRFDMNRSGAGLTWEHFMGDAQMPAWISAVEARDLWRLTPQVETIHAALTSYPMTLSAWDAISVTPLTRLLQRGEIIRESLTVWIGKVAAQAYTTMFEGRRAVAINIPYQNSSEVAAYLLREYPNAKIAILYFRRADGRWQYSLRSRDVDVSEIAVRHGGGGHRQAAGFEADRCLDLLEP